MGTPCPAGYVGVLRMVLLVFLGIIPHILLDDLGWVMVPTASSECARLIPLDSPSYARRLNPYTHPR